LPLKDELNVGVLREKSEKMAVTANFLIFALAAVSGNL
jgi:hypothetical protein